MAHRVLIADLDASVAGTLASELARRGFEPILRTSADDIFSLLADEDFDAIVADLGIQGTGGVGLCERCVLNRPDIPVIATTAVSTVDTAVAAIRAGAYDFLAKPFAVEALVIALERAVKHRALREEVKRLKRVVADSQRQDEILGSSPAMKKVFDLLDRIADSDSTVHIGGETGTGKELVARALHRRSRRASAPFVAVNCAAMPESLLESELFGHAKGAFTDARAARAGLLVHASGGTIFLDEIGDMPAGMQVKLLRVLQERRVRPVGGDAEVAVDVRVLSATNRDLETAVHEGKFREDLFYRLNVIQVNLPPLRARGNDILLLAQHFLERCAGRANKRITGISSGVAQRLLSFPWPGNVRELQNCIERAVALARYEELTVEDLSAKIRDHAPSHVLVAGDDPSELVPLAEMERRYLLRVIEAVGHNKTLAARILGLDRKTLYRRLERYQNDSGRWSTRDPGSDELPALPPG
jgi:two-component system response regulator HydG